MPLGGVGEIGMNMALYGYGSAKDRQWIIVDVGVTFPGPELPGVNLILPDIQFVEENIKDIKGIVITHAHEDHYGALLSLWPKMRLPVYCTPFTAGMLESKMVSEPGAPEIPLHVFKAGETVNIGDFEVEAINVTHSIPEPVALAIKTPLGKVIHTGDWKMDPDPTLGNVTDEKRLKELGDEGILALVCDSTNAMRDGVSPTETAVSESLEKVISDAPGRVLITTFSSNAGRIRSIAQAAKKVGRKVMLSGRSLRRVADVSRELGYLDGLDEFVDEEMFDSIPRKELVMILTGSQGENRAALAKLAFDKHPRLSITPGDSVVFSSRTIPGNEKPIIEIKNELIEKGVEIITDNDALVHVSGHPRIGELKNMYKLVRPTIAVPVHGEAAHLVAHGKLAASFGVPDVAHVRNGNMLRLAPGPSEIVDDVPFGRTYKDGHVIGTFDDIGVRERRSISFAGLIVVSANFDVHYNLADEPDMVIEGLPYLDGHGSSDEDEMEVIIYRAVMGTIKSFPKNRRKDLAKLRESIRRAVRSAVNERWGKKPVTHVFVNRF